MGLYTRYGSQVEIVRSFKQNAAIGVFLVQAMVTGTGVGAPHDSEVVGKLVAHGDRFSAGWIPSTDLIGSEGPQEVLTCACDAAEEQPANAPALFRLYWPNFFGPLTAEDILSRQATGLRTIIPSVRATMGLRA